MRIYLDSNIFQELKKPEKQSLYNTIIVDKNKNYYFFSEAHIQDLTRDKTGQKLTDMEFIETIVDKNCWHYSTGLELYFLSPTEYYKNYDWTSGSLLMNSHDTFAIMISEYFRTIPLDWKEHINTEEMPVDFPEDMRPLLLESFTMLDFMDSFLELTNDLSNEQPRFRRLLQYLHRSMKIDGIYEKMGIIGFNGTDFTDWNAFTKSFKKVTHNRSHEKDLYNLFIQMQYSLDIFGIIKGKPKKQKFISLLNDGKHAYYAAHAHILVTNDSDMIAKSKLLFRIWELETTVFTLDQFEEWLVKSNTQDSSVAAMFKQFDQAAELPIIFEEYSLDKMFIQKQLPTWYLSEFNTLSCASFDGFTYYYFEQVFANLPLRILTIELERVVNQLIDHFGIDELGHGKFDSAEIDKEDWQGREWRIAEMAVLLKSHDGIMLYIFKAAPLHN